MASELPIREASSCQNSAEGVGEWIRRGVAEVESFDDLLTGPSFSPSCGLRRRDVLVGVVADVMDARTASISACCFCRFFRRIVSLPSQASKVSGSSELRTYRTREALSFDIQRRDKFESEMVISTHGWGPHSPANTSRSTTRGGTSSGCIKLSKTPDRDSGYICPRGGLELYIHAPIVLDSLGIASPLLGNVEAPLPLMERNQT